MFFSVWGKKIKHLLSTAFLFLFGSYMSHSGQANQISSFTVEAVGNHAAPPRKHFLSSQLNPTRRYCLFLLTGG